VAAGVVSPVAGYLFKNPGKGFFKKVTDKKERCFACVKEGFS